MDLANILNVRTLNDYIAATEVIVKKCTNMKIQLNMSTVLNLKKVRSLEIEYFNKCEENGAAFVIFDCMLRLPPSKTWGLLGKELVSMLQYWLDAVRRHLISHNQHWWNFLKTLMRFIKEIKSKDPSILSVIVELTTEGFLELASHARLGQLQRQQLLKTVNECCAEASRELRGRVRDRLGGYFVKLSAALSSCGHLPTQMGILETLLRWLVGRCDERARRAAAAAWFPPELFHADTVQLFMERPWRDFYQDARDFLNSHNAHHPDCVTSVLCRRLSVGGVNVIGGAQSKSTWLDVNAETKSITIILVSHALEGLATNKSYETLTIAEDNVCSLQLYRTISETILAVQTVDPLPLGEKARALVARVPNARLRRLDAALRAAFADKYQVLLNLDAPESSPSSDNTVDANNRSFKKLSSSEDDRRPAIPAIRRHRSAYILRLRNPLTSPSTASTTSLAQLHDRLAALPHLVYNKEAVKVSIHPELSMVREVSECDDRSSINLSQTGRAHGGVYQRHCDSDVNATRKINFGAPTNKKSSDLILAATLGPTDESIINDTYEQIYGNNKEVDILDLLVKEALQSEQDKDSGIITDKKTQDTEFIENTPIEKQVSRKKVSKIQKAKSKCTVVSNSTTDESNTEFANEAPCFVSDRRNRARTKVNNISEETKSLDAEAVDAFFSKHISENTAGQLVISPTLAKKINETSAETSEVILDEVPDLNKNSLMIEVEIIDCLNEIVDEVACNFEKCTEMLGQEQEDIDILEIALDANTNQKRNEMSCNFPKENENTTTNITLKPVTLRLQPSKKRVLKRNKQNAKQKKAKGNNVEEDNIIEEDVFIENADTNSPVNKSTTPLIRKKRKLYSPKDDESDPMEEIPLAKLETRRSKGSETPLATCYKELEIARKARSRIPKKIRASTVPITSPKTKKLNDIFDKLKEKVDNEEKITQVNTKSNNKDLTIFNLTSDSEDEDFKMKKTEIKKRANSNNIESTATKRGRLLNRVKYTDSSTDDNSKKAKKRKSVKQKKSISRKMKEVPSNDLIDERIREAAPETLEISFEKETPTKTDNCHEPELNIKQAPVMEPILNDICDAPTEIISVENYATQKKKKAENLQIKKEKGAKKKTEKAAEILEVKKEKAVNKKGKLKASYRNKVSEPSSPLPGLVVETEKSRKDDITASVEATMLQKFNKIYNEGPEVDESDGTQNLLLRFDKYKTHEINNGVDYNALDGIETVESATTYTSKDVAVETTCQDRPEPDENIVEAVQTIVLSDAPSEKSIATDGKSPITGHNDLDELPPNMESLKEHIEYRDLEIQDMNQSMADFFLQLRNRSPVKTQTPPRASTEKSQPSPILLNRLSSKDRLLSKSSTSASTPKVSICSVKLVRLEEYKSPYKSSDSSRTPEVVLERMSSDEINKWLPMPLPSQRKVIEQEEPKRYNTRMSAKKSVTSKKSPMKKVKNNIISAISPIKLSFDINENINCDKFSGSLRKVNRDTSFFISNTPTQISREASKEKKTLASPVIDIHQETEVETNIKQSQVQSSSVEYKSLAEEKSKLERNINKDKENKDKASEKAIVQSAHSSEASKSIASVNEWFKRNILTSSPSKGDTAVGKEILEKVMETLETTLEEIQQETGKNLASMLVENQKCLNSFREESARLDERTVTEIMAMVQEKWAERDRRLKEIMEEFEKGQKERAIEITRSVNARHNLMVQLLKEDLQAVLDFNAKQNK